MTRYGHWIQDPDIVINATTPADVADALTAAGNGGRRLDGADPGRTTESTGQISGDVTSPYNFFSGTSTFDAVCEGAPEHSGPTFPRPAGLAAVWSENDTRDTSIPVGKLSPAFRFAYDLSNTAFEAFVADTPEDDLLTSIGAPVLKPFGTGATNVIVGVANTVLDVNLYWLIGWDLPTSSHWPTGALDIQMDPARADSIYDGGLIGSADIGLRFTNKSVDHYGFYRYWPWSATDGAFDETAFRWHSTTDPAGVAGSDTFELRLLPADLPTGGPMITATQLTAGALLAAEAIAPIHPTAPTPHVTGSGFVSPYDYTNAADQAPFDFAITVDSMGPRVACAFASQRTKTQPATPAEGELVIQDDFPTTTYYQMGRANFVAVDVSPDGDTVRSVQLTWRPPRYRFLYEGVVPLRQRQTSTGIHTAGTPLRQRQHHFGLRQRQTGI